MTFKIFLKRLLWLGFCGSDINGFIKYEFIRFQKNIMDF